MTKKVLCLALLCLYNLMPPSESIIPARRSKEVYEKYVLHDGAGGASSHLFSQCLADARTVEGVLYSIAVADDEEYVRFVPEEKMEFQWTIVDLGDGMGTVDCAQKAYELGAYMFKFDVSCNVALSSSYDPKSKQACGGAATEVVYITSRPFFAVDGEIVPLGESRGCYYNSPEGMRYGNEEGHLLDEVQLPPPDVCSPTADRGYHLVADCSLDKMNFCEGQARCEARGLPMASKSFYDEFAEYEDFSAIPSDVAAAVSSRNRFSAWMYIQKIDNTWNWMPDMVVIPESNFSSTIYPEEECAIVSVMNLVNVTKMFTWKCFSKVHCVYCHDPNSILPQC